MVACLLIGLLYGLDGGRICLSVGWWRICLLVGSGVVFYFLSFKKMGGEGRVLVWWWCSSTWSSSTIGGGLGSSTLWYV